MKKAAEYSSRGFVANYEWPAVKAPAHIWFGPLAPLVADGNSGGILSFGIWKRGRR
jgi:hypothetical protein